MLAYMCKISNSSCISSMLIFMVGVQVIRLATLCDCTICLGCVLLAALTKIRQRCILLEFLSTIYVLVLLKICLSVLVRHLTTAYADPASLINNKYTS
uniref:LSM4 homolog, U6 small nuclear RNA and mRNA degradation associated n=1 Tax=Aegilops tauschii subsp. strangulata TaxID=200361 RepID=A0A453EMR1_AEGTS